MPDKEKQLQIIDRETELSECTGSIESTTISKGCFRDFIDSFKRADLHGIDTEGMSEEELQNILTAKAPLKRSLHSWQISLIAIGGSIGSGLFIGSGTSFQQGGVGALMIGFTLMGLMIFATMQCAGCLATAIPVNGSYIHYSTRFVSKSIGCTLAWVYLEGWLVSVPLELVSSAITISFWDTDNNAATRVSKAAWVSIFYVTIFFINMFGAAGYGWGEAILCVAKVVAVIGFCIFGIIVNCGGYSGQYAASRLATDPNYLHGLTGKYIGGYFWHHPGAFSAGFKGVVNTAINAAFSFSGSELCALAAAETKNPEIAVPRAVKQVFWRILLFYIVSLCIAGSLVPYTDQRLGSDSTGRSSPFVIAISNANVKALPSIFNVVILLAVLSVGNAGVFAASRTCASMAAQGFAPKFFGYIDRKGRPLFGIGLCAVFGLLCFLVAYDNYSDVFNWMMAISGVSALFSWGFMNFTLVRFYHGMKAQGRSLDELSFKPMGGIYMAYIGMFLNFAILILQFWIALYPVGVKTPSASGFFQTYLSVPLLFIFFIVSRLYFKEKHWYIKGVDMDLDTGRRETDPEKLIEKNLLEKQRIRSRGFLYRAYCFWC